MGAELERTNRLKLSSSMARELTPCWRGHRSTTVDRRTARPAGVDRAGDGGRDDGGARDRALNAAERRPRQKPRHHTPKAGRGVIQAQHRRWHIGFGVFVAVTVLKAPDSSAGIKRLPGAARPQERRASRGVLRKWAFGSVAHCNVAHSGRRIPWRRVPAAAQRSVACCRLLNTVPSAPKVKAKCCVWLHTRHVAVGTADGPFEAKATSGI